MKENWEYKNIEECLEKVAVPSKLQTKDFLPTGEFPVVSQEEDYISGYWNGEVDVVRLSHPIVVFGDHSRVVKYIDFDFVVGADGVKILSPKAYLDPKFLYYFVRYTDVPSLGYSRHYKLLREKDVPIPPLTEQSQIVAELDLLSGVIDKQKAELRELDNLAQSTFYDMFGDPDQNSKNWETKYLSEVCVSELGKTLNHKTDTGDLKPYLCAINVYWNQINLDVLKEAKFEDSTFERYSVRKGDLLVCEGGDIGRCAIWDKDYPILYQNALHRIRFNADVVPVYCLFVLWYLKSHGILDNRYGKGVTIKHLVKSSLYSILIPIPPLALQQSFADKITSIEKQKAVLSQSIVETQKLLDYTMDKYFG